MKCYVKKRIPLNVCGVIFTLIAAIKERNMLKTGYKCIKHDWGLRVEVEVYRH
jgi:hypothetical protein